MVSSSAIDVGVGLGGAQEEQLSDEGEKEPEECKQKSQQHKEVPVPSKVPLPNLLERFADLDIGGGKPAAAAAPAAKLPEDIWNILGPAPANGIQPVPAQKPVPNGLARADGVSRFYSCPQPNKYAVFDQMSRPPAMYGPAPVIDHNVFNIYNNVQVNISPACFKSNPPPMKQAKSVPIGKPIPKPASSATCATGMSGSSGKTGKANNLFDNLLPADF